MASNQRTYPNTYFAWYNDDNRLAVVSKDTESVSGERTTELYDTWQGQGDLSGNITAFANYTSTVSGTTKATCTDHGLETGDRVTITSLPDSYYNGTYSITSINSNEFYFTKAYSAEDSGKFTVKFINDGIRITYTSKYEKIDPSVSNYISNDLRSDYGLDSGMQVALLYYVKARLYEDIGDMEKSQYFRKLFYREVKQYPSRKTGVRVLAVPNL